MINQYVVSIAKKYMHLGWYCVAFSLDRVKLEIKKSWFELFQKLFCDGWTSRHYISNVFMFAPDSCIHEMVINAPRAMHDSVIMETGDL